MPPFPSLNHFVPALRIDCVLAAAPSIPIAAKPYPAICDAWWLGDPLWSCGLLHTSFLQRRREAANVHTVSKPGQWRRRIDRVHGVECGEMELNAHRQRQNQEWEDRRNRRSGTILRCGFPARTPGATAEAERPSRSAQTIKCRHVDASFDGEWRVTSPGYRGFRRGARLLRKVRASTTACR